MKYKSATYARAFTETVENARSREEKNRLIRNFLAIIQRNRDFISIKKIIADTEKRMRAISGKRNVVIQTARPQKKNIAQILHEFTRKDDVIEARVDPMLIAGVRIVINDEEMFDNTLKRKLEKLFI